MKKLRARLYSMRLEEETAKRYSARKIQVKMNLRNTKIFIESIVLLLLSLYLL